MLNLAKCLLTALTFTFIHWQALDVRKTKICTKYKEKIGLKLELENCEKTKFFFNLAFTVFSF